jgi:hypothetical protein
VRRIVGWYKMGMSPEEIALEYPHLNLAQVHAALAYYHANREEIEPTSLKRKPQRHNGSITTQVVPKAYEPIPALS